jgi:hypothetical protein
MAATVDVFLVLRCVPIARQAVNDLHRIVLVLERGCLSAGRAILQVFNA